MIKSLKKIYRKNRKKIKFFFSINWVKTLYFNYKKFPLNVAKKLPVYFYGNVKLSSISGKISINAPIKTGMIGFGQQFEKFTRSKGIAELYLKGRLVFKCNAHIGKDCFLYIGNDAYCEFGDMACLGSDVKLICTNKLVLGNWAGIGYESQISDTNYHPMKNTETDDYYPMSNPIYIGDHNAISNRVSILPGTKTPEHCVVASNSVCNMDYTTFGNNILIGGIPAKLIKNNYARDWDIEKEKLRNAKSVKW